MFQIELADLFNDLSDKIHEFQLTGYSFEEWFNWELYAKFKKLGYSVTPKPALHSPYKSYADLLVEDSHNNTTYIEVKLVHDSTTNKWLEEIEKDRKALQSMGVGENAKGLQLLLLTSSHENLLEHPHWKPWLERLSFWDQVPELKVTSKYGIGNILLLGWIVSS